MVGKLLVRGMLAGIAAGLLTFGFAKIVGEPQVDQAISFEEKADAAKGDAPGPEIVSRATQSGYGLFTGVMVYGASIGGLFALVFAYAHGRTGRLSPRALSAWLALAAFVAIYMVPNLKYPANPPSVGDPETIGYRTGLFFLMIAISIAVSVFSLKVRAVFAARLGVWNAAIAALVLFVVVIGAIGLALPAVNEVPAAFPAVLLWKFRAVSVGMQAILWTTIGLLFGAFAEKLLGANARAGRARVAQTRAA
ncbi:CbtA family protein [Paraburkholderia lycopersici]|uniref:Probable cobalt transporter subunit (CbtA) n=1 Tax=Paraburkholderia lycopersici TaxID=416944 RepID=A0A1G6LDZ9_9BURK|nr:CbtA family protein [Paraburkholderia lycopersici]SDC41652.1 Probable cobalt transporter subunit (CbtA) [Paraburkholderia lycopersici]